jgi:hypothetical protein
MANKILVSVEKIKIVELDTKLAKRRQKFF